MGKRLVGHGRVLLTAALIMATCVVATETPARAASADADIAQRPGGLSSRLAALVEADAPGHTSAAGETRDEIPAEGPGSLMRSERGLVLELRMAGLSADTLEGIEATGARVRHVSESLGLVTVEARTSQLQVLTEVPGVAYVGEVLTPLVGSERAGEPLDEGTTAAVQPPCGLALSEADGIQNVDDLRSAHSVEGAGVKVGILSDSWDTATGDATDLADDEASGDIPGPANPCPGPGRRDPVFPVQDFPGGTDEGRAMAQLVHDLAPAAELAFRTAFTGLSEFADNIESLWALDGSDVIVDDIFYFAEPAFQQGPIAAAAEDAVAAGVPYITAVGNEDEVVDGKPVGAYEAAEFRPGPCPASVAFESMTCHDFDPGPGVDTTYRMTLNGGRNYALGLHWAEPWYGVTTDLDLYLLNASGEIVGSGTDWNPGPAGSQRPFEFLNGVAASPTRDVVIARYSGAETPRFKLLHVRTDLDDVEYSTTTGPDVYGPNVTGHAAAPNVISVGAVDAANPVEVEPFSSRGPATHYFGPVDGTTPASPIVPQIMQKPEVSALDGVSTTFFAGWSHRFYGTSAAAPHAAAIAALLLECNPSLSPLDIEQALIGAATPLSSPTSKSGAGLIDAAGSGDLVCPPTSDTVAPVVSAVTTDPTHPTSTQDVTVTALVVDAASAVVSAALTVDGGASQAMAASDGTFDGTTEAVTATLAPLTDGSHVVCVTGTDEPGNTTDPEVCTTVIVGDDPPPADATGPTVSALTFSPVSPTSTQNVTVRATATDAASVVTAASVRVDGGAPVPMTAQDGAFDSLSETVIAPLGKLTAGSHSVCVSAVDQPGNVTTPAACASLVVTSSPPGGSPEPPDRRPPDAPPAPPDDETELRFDVDSDGDGVSDGIEEWVEADPDDPSDNKGSVAGQCPRSAVPAGRFGDVGGVHAPAIECANWYGWVLGRRDGIFEPDGTTSRGQIASILSRLLDDLDVKLSAGPVPVFTDLAGSVHAGAIARLGALGVILGRADGTFGPDDPVTRAQIASLMSRLADAIGQPLAAGTGNFTDVAGNVHEDAINALAAADVLRGVDASHFIPDAFLTRAQLASVVVRFAAPLVGSSGLRPPTN